MIWRSGLISYKIPFILLDPLLNNSLSLRAQVQTLNEQESEKLLQQSVLADVRDAFDSSVYGIRGMPPPTFGDGGSEDGGGGGGQQTEGDPSIIVPDLLSPSGPTDAQTLALMLQQQLDAINNEIRYCLCASLGWCV